MGISKDSYYHNQSKQSTLKSRWQSLKPKIGKILEHNPHYGYPRIKKALKDNYGIIINHKLLLKLLKLWGLELKRKTRKKKKTWMSKVLAFLQSKANLLRQLEAKTRAKTKEGLKACFQVIVSDMTEISFKAGKAYLCVHLDYVGKLVYGWSLSLDPNRFLMISSFNKAVKRLKSFGIKAKLLSQIIFHQDRGVQYTSTDYISAVLDKDVYLSYSKKGEPGDNAVNEAFFSRLKEEWRDIFAEAESLEELEKLVKKAIDYYNERRYHTSINNQTPLEFTKTQAKLLQKSSR